MVPRKIISDPLEAFESSNGMACPNRGAGLVKLFTDNHRPFVGATVAVCGSCNTHYSDRTALERDIAADLARMVACGYSVSKAGGEPFVVVPATMTGDCSCEQDPLRLLVLNRMFIVNGVGSSDGRYDCVDSVNPSRIIREVGRELLRFPSASRCWGSSGMTPRELHRATNIIIDNYDWRFPKRREDASFCISCDGIIIASDSLKF